MVRSHFINVKIEENVDAQKKKQGFEDEGALTMPAWGGKFLEPPPGSVRTHARTHAREVGQSTSPAYVYADTCVCTYLYT